MTFETTPAAPAPTDPALAQACDEVAKELLARKLEPLAAGERIGPLPRLVVLALSAAADAAQRERDEAAALRQRAMMLEAQANERSRALIAEVLQPFGRALGQTTGAQSVVENGATFLVGVGPR